MLSRGHWFTYIFHCPTCSKIFHIPLILKATLLSQIYSIAERETTKPHIHTGVWVCVLQVWVIIIRHISALIYCTLHSLNNHQGICYNNVQNTKTELLNHQTLVICKSLLCYVQNVNTQINSARTLKIKVKQNKHVFAVVWC